MYIRILASLCCLSLLLVSCDDRKKDITPTHQPQQSAVEYLAIDSDKVLAATWHGKWVYTGRILDPDYFLQEDIPQELRDAKYFIDISKPQFQNVEKWRNELLRTIYKTLFSHAKKNEKLLGKEATVTEKLVTLPSVLTRAFGEFGQQTLPVSGVLVEDKALEYTLKQKLHRVELREEYLLLDDSQPFRWIVLRRVK